MRAFEWVSSALVLLSTVQRSESQSVDNYNISCVPFAVEPNQPLRCGGVINDLSGTLFHKPYEPIEKNERCVWTLAAPIPRFSKFVSYEIHVLYLGFPANSTDVSVPRLIIAPISFKQSSLDTFKVINSTGRFYAERNLALVLTFTSGEFEGHFNGFILQYKVAPSDHSAVPHHKIAAAPVKMRYNFTGTNIQDVSTLVIPPKGNYITNGKAFSVVYLESHSNDVFRPLWEVTLYHFNSTSLTHPWELADKVSSGEDTRVFAGSSDLVMLVIRAQLNNNNIDLFNMRCK